MVNHLYFGFLDFFFHKGYISSFSFISVSAGFLTGVLQNHARKYNIPIDTLQFNYQVYQFHEDVTERIANKLENDGVLVNGLYLEGARWDMEKERLQDSFPMEMFSVSLMIETLF